MPPDGTGSELDDALFGAVGPGPTPSTGASPLPGVDEVSTLDSELFVGPPAEPDLVTEAIAAVSAALFRPEPTPAARSVDDSWVGTIPDEWWTAPATEEIDLTGLELFDAVPDGVDDGPRVRARTATPPGRREPGRRERREREEAARHDGRLRRVSLAAGCVVVVVGLGGLGYAALGTGDNPPAHDPNQVEVRGAEVTRATTSSTSAPSTSAPSTTPATTVPVTTAPPVTTPAPLEPDADPEAAPEPEPPATDPPVEVPPAADPPPPPPSPPPVVTDPAPPTTLAPPPSAAP